jgi:hypothetical protein
MEILAPKLETPEPRLCNPKTSSYFYRCLLRKNIDQFPSVSINGSVWLRIDFVGSSEDQDRLLQEDKMVGEADQAAGRWWSYSTVIPSRAEKCK